MKSAPFEYRAPDSIDEALSLLAAGDGVRVLAGGQSLVPLMKARVVKPTLVVDVNRVPGLDGIDGAGRRLTRDRRARAAAGAAGQPRCRRGAAAAPRGRPLRRLRATRHRGTVGGSLAYAAPWAELTAAVVALDAEHRDPLGARRADGGRAQFFRGPHETALEPDELLTAVRDPGCRRARRAPASTRSARATATTPRSPQPRPSTLDDGGNVHGGRARPPPRRADAAPGGRLPLVGDDDRRGRMRGGRGVARRDRRRRTTSRSAARYRRRVAPDARAAARCATPTRHAQRETT